MSGIGSVSGYNSESYYQWLRQVNSSTSSQSVSATSDSKNMTSIDVLFESDTSTSSTSDDQLNSLEEQIKKAIEEALQNYLNTNGSNTSDTSDSSGTSSADSGGSSTISSMDLMEVIKSAVDNVMKENGIDPEKLMGPMNGMQGMPPPPPPPPGMMPPGLDSTSTDGTSSTSDSESTIDSQSSSDQIDQLIKLMQELLKNLENNQDGNNSLSGYLFDQQS
jgi:hypothetical protein